MMKKHGHREGNITHQGLSGVGTQGRDSRGWGDRGEIVLGEIPNLEDGVMDVANLHGTCIPV